MATNRTTSAKKAATKATKRVAKKAAPVKKAATKATKRVAKKAAPVKKAAKTAAKKTAPMKKSVKRAVKKVTPDSAYRSKFFAAARSRAEKLAKDPKKLQRIAEQSYMVGNARGGPFADVMDDFRALVRLVVAYARGNYRDIPFDSLVIIVAGLIYVVMPLDLIPDVLPGGLIDDAGLIAWVLKTVKGELNAFREWELGADN